MSENSPIIQFKNITKQYKLYKSDKERFRAIFSKSVKAKTKKAVDDVSFDIFKGESVAMFGRNGARKSTINRKSTRLNSSHVVNSYAVFCLKKKK